MGGGEGISMLKNETLRSISLNFEKELGLEKVDFKSLIMSKFITFIGILVENPGTKARADRCIQPHNIMAECNEDKLCQSAKKISVMMQKIRSELQQMQVQDKRILNTLQQCKQLLRECSHFVKNQLSYDSCENLVKPEPIVSSRNVRHVNSLPDLLEDTSLNESVQSFRRTAAVENLYEESESLHFSSSITFNPGVEMSEEIIV
ncbi:DgyrCDS7026 [Dimorphilus gyrociliatus]|uniref:DgyrCDS7026 n=1 Tax=Dimorphilus gyrociliatus TaxID=2664684 RepID=A0A7I8VRH5_9ANNE|nr:DgyrCDS7026 [Dimorphilus gyrociliatus]